MIMRYFHKINYYIKNLIIIFVLLNLSTLKLISEDATWEWVKQLGDKFDNVIWDQVLDDNGNIYLTGYIKDNTTIGTVQIETIGYRDCLVTKLTSAGEIQWVKHFGGSDAGTIGRKILINSKNELCIIGTFNHTIQIGKNELSTGGYWDNVFKIKMSLSGEIIGAVKFDYQVPIIDADIDSDDNIYILNTEGDGYGILKIDDIDQVLWEKGGIKASGDVEGGIEISYNSVIISGSFYNDFSFEDDTIHSDDQGIFLLKLNLDGNIIFNKRFKLDGYDVEVNKVNCDNLGNIFICGKFKGTLYFDNINIQTDGTTWDWDAFIVKFDNNGNSQWAKNEGGDSRDNCHGLTSDYEGNSYLGGYIQGQYGTPMFFYQYNTEGAKEIHKVTSSNFYGTCVCADIEIDKYGNGIISGNYSGDNKFDNISLMDQGLFVGKINNCYSPMTLPSPPRNLRALAYETGAKILWDNSETDGVKYSLYRSEVSGVYNDEPLFNEQAHQIWEDINLEKGKTYYYVARAVKDGAESENSNEDSITISLLDAPENLTAEPDNENKQIILTWDAVDYEATYSVYRVQNTSDGDYSNVVPIAENLSETEYIDKAIEYDVKYYYVVRAVRDNIYSDISNEASGVVHDPVELAELNNLIETILQQCGELENLNDTFFELTDDIQISFYQFLNDNYYQIKDGYYTNLIQKILINWRENPPTQLTARIEILSRVQEFFYYLIESYVNNENGPTMGRGLKDISSQMTQTMADFWKDIIALGCVFIDFQEDPNPNYSLETKDFLSVSIDYTSEFLSMVGFPYPSLLFDNVKTGIIEPKKLKKSIGKSIISEGPKIAIDVLTPYWKSYDLSNYFNLTKCIENTFIKLESMDYSGDVSETHPNILNRLHMIKDVVDGYTFQYGVKQNCVTAVNLFKPCLDLTINKGDIFSLKVKFMLQAAIVCTDVFLWKQRYDFIYQGPSSMYHLGEQRFYPKFTDEAFTAAFHPDQLGIIQKDKKGDVSLGGVSANISADRLFDSEIIEGDTLLMQQIKANIGTDIDYFTNNFDNIKESGEKACEEIKNLRLPVSGIPADVMLTDTNFYSTVVDLQTDIEMLRAYRRIVTSSVIYYRSDATNERVDTLLKYIDLYLDNFPKVVTKTEDFMEDNSDKIKYPVFDIVSVSSEESGANQYDITIKFKNYGADLINGKARISYLCDKVEYLTQDPIEMSDVSSLSEIEITSKAMLQSSTGIVTIIAEYLFDESSRYSLAEINIPITAVNVEEKGNQFSNNSNLLIITPNPATTFLNISFSENKGSQKLVQNGKIKIYNLLGVQVLEIDSIFESTRRIDVSGLPPGVYLLNIGAVSQMFVKE